MSLIWDNLIGISKHIENKLREEAEPIYEEGMERFNKPGWVNKVYSSDRFRRAHIDIVDARETKGLWMMHFCIFPHLHNDSPIFGYDVVAGENKITGFFHDFSPMSHENHPLSVYFKYVSQELEWNKPRELPEWAKNIFSKNMIAAGNVKEEELNKLDVVLRTLKFYMDNVGYYNQSGGNFKDMQNRYGFYQRQNPHTPRTMKALGLDDKDVDLFVNKCLFPVL